MRRHLPSLRSILALIPLTPLTSAFLLLPALAACGSSAQPAQTSPPTTVAPDAGSSPVVIAPAPATALTLEQSGIRPTWMDTSADPCEDFFAYACGGFVKTEEIPADRPAWGATEELDKTIGDFLRSVLEDAADAAKKGSTDPIIKKIGDYYASCMDEGQIEQAGVSAIAAELSPARAVKDLPSLYAAIALLHTNGIPVAFTLTSFQDAKDATQVILQMTQAGLGLPERAYYLENEGNMKSVREFYVGHVGRMLALAGTKPGDIKRAVADVMRIETAIAKISLDQVALRDTEKTYNRVERVGLKKLAPKFPWDRYFTAVGLPDVTTITVQSPAYFTKLSELLVKESPAAWANYLTWQVIDAEATHAWHTHGEREASVLPEAFVREEFSMRQKLNGAKELAPRAKLCVVAADGDLGELLAQPFVASRFAGDSKRRAAEIVAAIHAGMDADLAALPWMDAPTRDAARAKLRKINDKIGFPDTWKKYDFAVSRTSYAANSVAAKQWDIRRDFAKIGKPLDRNEWGMTPPTVNAYYDPSLNEIVLPAGQLQAPFFSRDSYTPVNIGDIGANTIGHELTHAFDDQGAKYDGNGNLRDWWSPGTKAKFEEAVKCVQNLYSRYEAVPGVFLKGEVTSGENIADMGGVKLGYRALEAWKTASPGEHKTVQGQSDESLFFLGYAQGWCTKETPQYLEFIARTDEHSPARFRVNGPMSQVPAFAEAFSCKPGTKMNPGNVCTVW